MRIVIRRLALLLALAFGLALAHAEEGAHAAAAIFGSALSSAHAEALRPILPQKGRVHLSLSRLGPEEGLFGAQQVEALFRDFLARGTISSFAINRCDSESGRGAVAEAAASLTDREGHRVRIGLHLAFDREGERWVLREVKETSE